MSQESPTIDAPPEAAPSEPLAVVEAFLDRLASADLDGAAALLDDDVLYTNVGLPSIRGRRRVRAAFTALERRGAAFEYVMHSAAAKGGVVLTERTDAIVLGPFRAQFWVTGRFDVDGGRITLWRDSFDFVDIGRSLVRGLVALAVPSLRTSLPGAGDAPGR